MLKEQFEWDEKNAAETIKFLEGLYKGCTSFFDDLDSQFERLNSIIPPQSFTKPALLKAWLLMDCRRQLALMACTLLRGHITDAFGNARRAVELTATIGRILRDETQTQPPATVIATAATTTPAPPVPPLSKRAAKLARKQAQKAAKKAATRAAKPDLTTLWFASDTEAGLDAYKNEAKMVNLWNTSLATVSVLQTRYSILCKKVHPGAASIVDSIPRKPDGSLAFDKYKPHQLTPDGTELMINFLFLTDCFIQILEGLAEIYAVRNDPSWTVSLNGWRGKRDLIRQVFMPLIKKAGAI